MKFKAIDFISIFLLMLVTGVFWGTWFTLTRSIEDFSPAEFIHIGKVIIANVAMPMRMIVPACILFMTLSLWLSGPRKSNAFSLKLFALILIISVLVITLTILVPIDNQIKQWDSSTIPPNWESIRSRWQTFHTVRTFGSIASFACFALSAFTHSR